MPRLRPVLSLLALCAATVGIGAATVGIGAIADAQAPDQPPLLDGVVLDQRCPTVSVRDGLGTLRFTVSEPVTIELRLALRQPSQRRQSCPLGRPLQRSPEVPYTTVAEAQAAAGAGAATFSLRGTGGALAPQEGARMRVRAGATATIRQAGTASVSLVQLTAGRPLERGTYVLFVTAKDSAGAPSPTRLVKLWVLPRPTAARR